MPNIALRFFNVYGPRQRASGAYGGVLSIFLKQTIYNKPLTITGDGNQTRDFIHVYDLVSAIIIALNKKNISENIFNIGSGNNISINNVTKLIGGKIVNIPKRPGDADHSAADIKKIKKNLKWKPKISLKNGLLMLLKTLKINRIK